MKSVKRIKTFVPNPHLSEYCPGRICVFKDRSVLTKITHFHSAEILADFKQNISIRLQNQEIIRIGKVRVLTTYEKQDTLRLANQPPIGSRWVANSRRNPNLLTIKQYVDPYPPPGFKVVVVLTNPIGRTYAMTLASFLQEYYRL